MTVARRIALIALIQTLVLLGLVGTRQFTLATGTPVVLETVPIDPRSLFQGDYVALAYAVGRLDLGALAPGRTAAAGDTLWVVLAPDGETWRPVAAGPERPDRARLAEAGQVALRGRVDWARDDCAAGAPAPCAEAFVTYGIETYFVPEGRGLVLEELVRDGGRVTVEAAVDRFGTAAIAAILVDGERVHVERLF